MEPARDYPRLARLGCVVTTQPSSYVHRSGLGLARSGVDPERLLAHRDYVDAGIPWALSSDNKPYWLMFTLWVAVTRRAMGADAVVGPGQRVSVPEALRSAHLGRRVHVVRRGPPGQPGAGQAGRPARALATTCCACRPRR